MDAKTEKTEAKEEKEKKEKKHSRRKVKLAQARGKRKEAIARATVTEGKGKVVVNGLLLPAVQDRIMRELVAHAMSFVDASGIDVHVEAHGGGVSGQAQAARTAVAKALVAFFPKDETLKQRMLDEDRALLIEDSRRVEPKKFKGPKARARFTKSYR